MGIINDTWSSSSLSSFSNSYTLDDLERDDEFQKTSERFLESVGEKSDDVFEYLRDSDFNLFSGMNRAIQSGKFNEQQKQDYAYLRSKFDNADMGSFKQYAELIKDATLDIATDPTAITAALLTPITGGTSLAARQGLTTAALQGSKAIAKNKLQDVGKKQIQKATAITGAEVGAWTGLDNHFRQNTEINVDLRKLYSTPELVSSAALGAITGGVFGNLAQRHSLYNEDLNRLFTNDEYRKNAGSELLFKARKAKDILLANTVGNPTRILRTTSEFSPKAKELGEKFSEEFSKQIGKRTTRRLGFSFSEDLNNTRGNFLLEFDAAVKPIRKTGHITKDNELAVIRILRGASDEGASDEVKATVLNLRKFYDNILKEAEEAGLEAPRIENYFPRSWNRQAIEENVPGFKKLLLSEKVEGITAKNVDDVIEQMLDKQNELFSSHSILLTQARTFRNLKDNNFEKYLTNDLIPVTTNYYMNAAKTIEHKKSFLLPGKTNKSNENQFIERYITPINQELRKVRGKGLTRKDKKRVIDLYKSVTGQVDYFDSGLIQGIYDTTKLANAMAYLPLATLSSLTEAMIPLAKAPLNANVKGMQSAVTRGHKIFTTEIGSILKEKHNMKPDEIVQEMNRVFIAVDEAMGDVTNRISGEGLQNEFLKKQARRFYRFNLLVPWTKTVQLASFSTGKDLIRDNLTKLNKFKTDGENILSEIAPMKIQKLRSELFDLGIDVEDGIRWLDAGAKQSDAFYNEQLVRGAGRFTNSIILPTARESARVPTYMTNPKIDIFTQFLRYPTVFGNTILKNFARDTINNPAMNAPKVAAFVAMSTNVAKATNYWRTSEENRERMDSGEDAWRDTLKAYQRVGLLGPIEYGVRFTEALSYGQNPAIATANLGGPVLNDIVGMTLYNRGLLETGARKLPLIGTKNLMKKYTGFEPYTPIQNIAKEKDKKNRESFERYAQIATGTEEVVEGFSDRFDKLEGFRSNFAKGGLVKGKDDVPQTKEDPADRVDPFTGQPYSDQMTRLGFNIGGIIAKQLFKPKITSKELVEQLSPTKTFDEAIDLGQGQMGYAYKDINKNISVTLKDSNYALQGKEQTIYDIEVSPDIELDFIGNISKNKSKGLASKELDKILKEIDSRDMSMGLDVDSAMATKNNKLLKGLSDKDLKKWYERKGFIFEENSPTGYRPAKSEDKTLFKSAVKKITKKESKEIEKHFNKDYFEIPDSFISDPMTFKEMASQGQLKKGYINDGTDDIFYFDGKNKPVKISNASLEYSYQTEKYKVILKNNKTDQMARLGFNEGGDVNLISNRNHIYKRFVDDFGYRPEAVIGMLGNFAVESDNTFRHDIVQGELSGKPLVYTEEDINKGVINRATKNLKTKDDIGKPKKGYGIAQFDFMNDYYQDYLNNNDKKDSLDSQIEYINDVIQGTDTYKNFKGKMLASDERKKLIKSLNEDNVEKTTKSFMEIFEKPGIPHLDRRINEANRIVEELNLFKDQ